MGRVKVARISEIPEGGLKPFIFEGGKRVVIANSAGRFYAFEDRCSHDDGELASGQVICETQVECPRHGARFDLATGRAVKMPAVTPIEIYPIEIVNSEVWIQVPEESEVEP